MSKIIEFKRVSFSYENNNQILNDINFSIEAGESIGLVGANGVGKSTLMKLMLGLLESYTGEILVCGMPVNKKNLREIRKRIGYVFQDSDSQLFMSTVFQDVCFGPLNYGYSKADAEKVAMEAMKKAGCEHLKDKQIYKLSGGEKKMVSIATILALQPEIVIMDEPESSLDPSNRKKLMETVNGLEGTKIIASHDLDFVWETTEKVLLMGNGEIKAYGNTKEVLSDENLLISYGLQVPGCAIIEKLRKQLETFIP